MSLLSFRKLERLVRNGVITNVEPDYINSASVDITLGAEIMVEGWCQQGNAVSLRERSSLNMQKHTMGLVNGYLLQPGEFILAHSVQQFNLPHNISAEYKLKSSMARIGLEHLNAGWCDAGWNGSVLTLELKNMTRNHSIRIHPGVRIGQVVFFSHDPVPADASYAKRGRYNNDKSVHGVKP